MTSIISTGEAVRAKATSRRTLLKLIPAAAAASIVPAAAMAAKPELPVDKTQRLAEELAHALDDWNVQTNVTYSALVFPASSGRGLYFKNERLAISPQARLDNAIAELKAAAEASDPSIGAWYVEQYDPDKPFNARLMIIAGRV